MSRSFVYNNNLASDRRLAFAAAAAPTAQA